MSYYTRDTELRNVQANELYHLAVILEENDYWRKLMEIIPKELNNRQFSSSANLADVPLDSSSNGRKYNRDHIRLIENACKRQGGLRLCPQILFDEWGSSGRKAERPTLGVLLHLLLHAQLFRAADYVAETLLKETKPPRPSEGPGAEITCELPSSIFNEVHQMANNSENYPDTELLQLNAVHGISVLDNNKDYYTKYREPFVKHFPPASFMPVANDSIPIPPPRLQRSARLMKQQHLQGAQNLYEASATAKMTDPDCNTIDKPFPSKSVLMDMSTNDTVPSNIPNISLLMDAASNPVEKINNASSIAYGNSLPKLSFLRNTAQSTIENFNNALDLCQLPDIKNVEECNTDLPAISALNLNGERDASIFTNSRDSDVSIVALQLKLTGNKNNAIDLEDLQMASILSLNECTSVRQNVEVNIDCITNNASDHSIKNEYDEGDRDDSDDVDDEDDDDDVPNLSIFNDSSLTSVTNTSGDNSFDQCTNDSRPTSADSLAASGNTCL